MKNQELYEKYLKLSDKISSLENEKKIIGEMIMQKMTLEKVDKVELPDMGLIKMAERITYIFTDAVKKQQEIIKELQQKEITDGIAEKKITKFLRATIK